MTTSARLVSDLLSERTRAWVLDLKPVTSLDKFQEMSFSLSHPFERLLRFDHILQFNSAFLRFQSSSFERGRVGLRKKKLI